MTSSKLLFWCAAAAGFAAFFTWFPRSTDSPQPRLNLTRQQTIDRAAAAIRDLTGTDVSSWSTEISYSNRDFLHFWQTRYAREPLDFLASGLEVEVTFERSNNESITAALCSNGQLCAIRTRGRRGPGPNPRRGESDSGDETPSTPPAPATPPGATSPTQGPPPDAIPEEFRNNPAGAAGFRLGRTLRGGRKGPRGPGFGNSLEDPRPTPLNPAPSDSSTPPLVTKAMRLLAGDFAPRFQPVASSDASEYLWNTPTPSSDQVRWEIRVRLDSGGSQLRDATLRAVIPESVRSQFRPQIVSSGEPARVTYAITVTTGTVILCILFVFAAMRRLMDLRSAATAGILYFATAVMASLPGTFSGLGRNSGPIEVGVPLVFFSLAATATIAVGYGWAREIEWPRWTTFRLFLQWQWRSRALGSSILAGLAWSGLVAAIPAILVATGAFGEVSWSQRHFLRSMLTSSPALAALHPWYELGSLAVFAILLPGISKRVGVPTVIWIVAAGLGGALLFLGSPLRGGIEPLIAYALLTFVALALLYILTDLMAVLVAGKAAAILTFAAAYLQTTNPSLTASGIWLLGTMASFGLVALVLVRRGIDVQPIDTVAANYLSQREKLKAEFTLAQQAQQRMLPSTPPDLPGFTLAATCQPAREVGGDLYDYFHLADGRIGFCVADVSGKGMSAALYMTLTKGLLTAASGQAQSLSALVTDINRHLHHACKRKVFVTAAVAAIDLANRSVEYIRAGHNPVLHYSAATGTATYRKPGGIGLGLTGGALFARGTRAETFHLADGDLLLLYSDGVTEAMNETLELYGEDRLLDAVQRYAPSHSNAGALLEVLRKDLFEFMGDEPAHDDITMLVLQAR